MAQDAAPDLAEPLLLAPPGCCVRLAPTGRVPAAVGVLGLGTAGGLQTFTVLASNLPPPATLGPTFTGYVAWTYGGGTLRLSVGLQPVPVGPAGTYAGGLGPLSPVPYSEIAVTAEPPGTATPTGPTVLLGSFASCL